PSRRPRSRPPPTRSQRDRAVAKQAMRPTRRRRRICETRIPDLAASLQETFAFVVWDRRRRRKALRCAVGAQQAWLDPRVFDRPWHRSVLTSGAHFKEAAVLKREILGASQPNIRIPSTPV